MKLAIVRWRIAATGGAERFIFDVAGALEGTGIEPTLIAEKCPRTTAFPGAFLQVPPSRGTRSRRYRAFQGAVSRALETERFDIVQTHERLLTADVYRAGDGVHAAWLDRLARGRPWWRRTAMRADPLHRLYTETERKMARETDMMFVANSALVAGELRDWLNVPASRLFVIENGVDLDRFAPATAEQRETARARLGIGDDRPVICYLGSGFERKGAFQLVRALAEPALAEATVVIAGRDGAQDRLRRLIGRLGLKRRALVMGDVADARSLLHAGDLFALPTMYDPMPNAALEALACGLPVVTTPDAGIADAVSESGAGKVAPRGPEALASALAETLGRLPRAREAALALRPRFDLKRAVGTWLEFYRGLS